ncbi:hypothetical protein DVH24_028232 [Malus domestica]|uniref:Terpene synthase metal-binding domain-containing protein n=1 Tax=Malus domestica TaxID=3750 RepID=A0A498HF49_MALDO|nr:hypothetical protein DVH24_028232 [Malus domestica]
MQTEAEIGETANSISLNMSEEYAREHIRNLVGNSWKKLNKDVSSIVEILLHRLYMKEHVFVSCETRMVYLSEANGLRPHIQNRMMVALMIRMWSYVIEVVESMRAFEVFIFRSALLWP